MSYKIKHSNTSQNIKVLSNQYYNGSIKLIAIKLRGTESHNEWDCILKWKPQSIVTSMGI